MTDREFLISLTKYTSGVHDGYECCSCIETKIREHLGYCNLCLGTGSITTHGYEYDEVVLSDGRIERHEYGALGPSVSFTIASVLGEPNRCDHCNQRILPTVVKSERKSVPSKTTKCDNCDGKGFTK